MSKCFSDNCLALMDYDVINSLNWGYNNPRCMVSPSNLLQELNNHFFNNNNNNNNVIRQSIWRAPPETEALLNRHNYYGLAGEANAREGSEMCVPRPRWCPTHDQIEILESIFEAGTVTPSRKLIAEIAAHLRKFGNVGEANVFYWFQNRKARAKRRAKNALKESESCNQNSTCNYTKEVQEGPKRRRRAAADPVNIQVNPPLSAAANEHVLIANDRPSSSSSSSSSCNNNNNSLTLIREPEISPCNNNNNNNNYSMSLIREPVIMISPQSYTANLEEQYPPLHPPFSELEEKIKIKSCSPLHLPQSNYFQEAYHVEDQALIKGSILGADAVDYYKQFPASPTYITTTASDINSSDSSIEQVVDDDFQLWDDMLAVAFITP